MDKFWVVRADKFWYKFDDKKLAENHYNYIFNNLYEKYGQIEKLYLAEYEGKTARLLKIWRRENEKEMI